MFCTKCGANVPDDAKVCPQCGDMLVEEKAAPQPQPAASMTDDEAAVKRIRDNAKICAILWIVVGAFQCITCFGIVAGVWNIVIGIKELKMAETIVVGNRAIFDYYDNMMNLLIIGAVINFLFGLLVGCALSAFEFFIRDSVIKNRKAFGA